MNINDAIRYLESRLELWRDMAATDIRLGHDARLSLGICTELSRAVDYLHGLRSCECSHLKLGELPPYFDDPAPGNWSG